jgi:hypothetical protein
VGFLVQPAPFHDGISGIGRPELGEDFYARKVSVLASQAKDFRRGIVLRLRFCAEFHGTAGHGDSLSIERAGQQKTSRRKGCLRGWPSKGLAR